MAELIKQIFCAKCQEVTPHSGSVDANGEFVFHCTNVLVPDPKDDTKEVYHHFIKFPADTDPAKFEALVTAHEEANKGQVSLEQQEKKLQEMLNPSSEPVNTAEAPVVPVQEAKSEEQPNGQA